MDKNKKNNSFNNNMEELDDLCENCNKYHESVKHNLILSSFKICESCRISKTLFPI